MTLNEFLAWDVGTDRRYELWGGVVTAIAPPMLRHWLLAAALSREIGCALRARPPCRVFSEAGIALPDRNDTFYVADLAVICEPLRADDRLIRNPVLIVEVLSPSTTAIDRQSKVPITAAFQAWRKSCWSIPKALLPKRTAARAIAG